MHIMFTKPLMTSVAVGQQLLYYKRYFANVAIPYTPVEQHRHLLHLADPSEDKVFISFVGFKKKKEIIWR